MVVAIKAELIAHHFTSFCPVIAIRIDQASEPRLFANDDFIG